jgi:uncharacterized protein
MADLDPLPQVDADSEPWWEATRQQQLLVQRCSACGQYQHYPRYLCTRCGSTHLEFVRASGHGRVYSFTVVHRPPSPAFRPPYLVALVRLQEGPILLTNIVECPPDGVRCEMLVEVSWIRLVDGRHLPVFKPTGGE